jgi:hypothetical protein
MTAKKTVAAFAMLAGLMLPAAALADTAAWEFTTVGTSLNNGVGWSFGEVFVPTENLNVTFLGYYSVTGDATGLAEDHPVSLYDAAGNLLAATVINSSSTYTDSDHFVFNPITSLELLAGDTYVIDGASGFVDPYVYDDPGFAVLAPINLLGDNWSAGNGSYFTGTGVIGDVSDGYWGPNFGWNTNVATTPEPSSLMLLGSGLVGFAGMLRRKLKA